MNRQALVAGMLWAATTLTGISREHTAKQSFTITVSVASFAAIPRDDVQQALGIAEGILNRGDVSVHWIEAPKAADIELFFVTRPARSTGRSRSALGASITPRPRRSTVYWDRVQRAAGWTREPPALVLGCVVAHELGHVLLGPTPHSETGLMRSGLSRADYERAARGVLSFTPEEKQLIHTNQERFRD